MARPNKTGLDYFPFDIDFFDDEKIMAISGEFGIKGEITTVKLLCAIYRNGYFIEWNDLFKFKLLKNLPGISSELLDSIVSRLVRWGFFDKGLFDSTGVLTSKGIQKRYFQISKRRKSSTGFSHLLIDISSCGTKEPSPDDDGLTRITGNVSAGEADSLSVSDINVCRNPEEGEDIVNVSNNGVSVCNNPFIDDINVCNNPIKKRKGNNKETESNDSAKKNSRFCPPTVEEVQAYISEKGYCIDPETFVNFYESKGWYVGKNKMKNWRAAVSTWQKNQKERNENYRNHYPSKQEANDYAARACAERMQYRRSGLQDELPKPF